MNILDDIQRPGKKQADDTLRFLCVILASIVMGVNNKIFVSAGGLYPGGFNGITFLIQHICDQFYGIHIPFTVVNLSLNAIPAIISYKFIGKRFTIFSCVVILMSSFLTDIIPPMPLTEDILLICIFGGIIHGAGVALCLRARATSGGTDFIAVALSERLNIDCFNYIFAGNVCVLGIAGMLFGWDKALYSIIFQFTSTQIVQMLNPRYQRVTLFIVSQKAEDIYNAIKTPTHHGGTLFRGTGLYNGQEQDMIYTVVTTDQVKTISRAAREVDPKAFINVIRTDQIIGRFYTRPND